MKFSILAVAFFLAATASALPLEARQAPGPPGPGGPRMSPKETFIQMAQKQSKPANVIQFLQGVPDNVFQQVMMVEDDNVGDQAFEDLMNGKMPQSLDGAKMATMESLTKQANMPPGPQGGMPPGMAPH
ncbi:hypothetical protein H072_11215 [Dactylellina haptotyla CBS 200.50]|uniref:STI1 domain-containing protein n=1 Tax=Dactylellina haptotyla (strain CBS 200.50) TaxID=1284197 RepID=S8BJI9_DACHA|nr:hypothetical protein H072_11215 [Dactylellina haptotyla CBS 200.50]